jgi:hypothetical protein
MVHRRIGVEHSRITVKVLDGFQGELGRRADRAGARWDILYRFFPAFKGLNNLI